MKIDGTHKYDDIIMLSHHVSKKHPRMTMSNRAAQFSPFAALSGHDAAIRETARLTDTFMELDENAKSRLNGKLRIIRENLEQRPEVEITYFQPDEKKSGGAYVSVGGRVEKIDSYSRHIVFTDGKALPLDQIVSIQGGLLESWSDV